MASRPDDHGDDRALPRGGQPHLCGGEGGLWVPASRLAGRAPLHVALRADSRGRARLRGRVGDAHDGERGILPVERAPLPVEWLVNEGLVERRRIPHVIRRRRHTLRARLRERTPPDGGRFAGARAGRRNVSRDADLHDGPPSERGSTRRHAEQRTFAVRRNNLPPLRARDHLLFAGK